MLLFCSRHQVLCIGFEEKDRVVFLKGKKGEGRELLGFDWSFGFSCESAIGKRQFQEVHGVAAAPF